MFINLVVGKMQLRVKQIDGGPAASCVIEKVDVRRQELARDAPPEVPGGNEGGSPKEETHILVDGNLSVIWKVLRCEVLDNDLKLHPFSVQSFFVDLDSVNQFVACELLNLFIVPGGWKIHNLASLKVLMPKRFFSFGLFIQDKQ